MAESIVGDSATEFIPEPAAPLPGSGITYTAGTYRWTYTGPREALTAAGLVPPDVPFPGDRPGRHQCRFVAPHGRKASIAKAVKGQFCVTIHANALDDVRYEARHARLAKLSKPASAPPLLAVLRVRNGLSPSEMRAWIASALEDQPSARGVVLDFRGLTLRFSGAELAQATYPCGKLPTGFIVVPELKIWFNQFTLYEAMGGLHRFVFVDLVEAEGWFDTIRIEAWPV